MSMIHSSSALLGSRSAVSFGTARCSTVRSIEYSRQGSASTASPIHSRRPAFIRAPAAASSSFSMRRKYDVPSAKNSSVDRAGAGGPARGVHLQLGQGFTDSTRTCLHRARSAAVARRLRTRSGTRRRSDRATCGRCRTGAARSVPASERHPGVAEGVGERPRTDLLVVDHTNARGAPDRRHGGRQGAGQMSGRPAAQVGRCASCGLAGPVG